MSNECGTRGCDGVGELLVHGKYWCRDCIVDAHYFFKGGERQRRIDESDQLAAAHAKIRELESELERLRKMSSNTDNNEQITKQQQQQ